MLHIFAFRISCGLLPSFSLSDSEGVTVADEQSRGFCTALDARPYITSKGVQPVKTYKINYNAHGHGRSRRAATSIRYIIPMDFCAVEL